MNVMRLWGRVLALSHPQSYIYGRSLCVAPWIRLGILQRQLKKIEGIVKEGGG